MALSKIQDFRGLSDAELQAQILETKRELFQLRFKQATRQMTNETHLFKHLRHRVSQLMTLERERELAQEQSPVPAAPDTSVDDRSES